jgi:hypothetical protein
MQNWITLLVATVMSALFVYATTGDVHLVTLIPAVGGALYVVSLRPAFGGPLLYALFGFLGGFWWLCFWDLFCSMVLRLKATRFFCSRLWGQSLPCYWAEGATTAFGSR